MVRPLLTRTVSLLATPQCFILWLSQAALPSLLPQASLSPRCGPPPPLTHHPGSPQFQAAVRGLCEWHSLDLCDTEARVGTLLSPGYPLLFLWARRGHNLLHDREPLMGTLLVPLHWHPDMLKPSLHLAPDDNPSLLRAGSLPSCSVLAMAPGREWNRCRAKVC